MFYEDFMTNSAGQGMLLDLSSMFSHTTDDLVCESIPSSQSSSSSSSATGSPPNFNLLPRFNPPPMPSGILKPGSMSVIPSSSVHRSEHLMSMSSSSTSIDVNNSIICTKQTEIRQKLQVLDAKIQLAQKSFHFKEEERLALLMEKSKLERELRRLIMNQKRQKRFRDRKRLRKKETLLRETSGGEHHAFETATFDSSSVDNSSPFAVQPDASGAKIPFTDSASKMPNLSFTQENWESLEQQFPLLLSCPFVGGEDSNPTQDKAYQQHRLGEIAFLNRIEQIAQGADPTVAVKDILTILQVRKIFVQDCIRFRSNIPARTLLYLSMVGQSPISEEEKHKLSALASGR